MFPFSICRIAKGYLTPLFLFFFKQKLNYIYNNPVEASIVYKPNDYIYYSALDYCGVKGLVKIEIIKGFSNEKDRCNLTHIKPVVTNYWERVINQEGHT